MRSQGAAVVKANVKTVIIIIIIKNKNNNSLFTITTTTLILFDHSTKRRVYFINVIYYFTFFCPQGKSSRRDAGEGRRRAHSARWGDREREDRKMADLEDVTLDGRPLNSLRVADLKAALEERGLPKSGPKNALVKRLKGVSSAAAS